MQSGNNIKPFLAIWMVTYNHGAYIRQAIESVMMQRANFAYKLYIGEDCSTDQTAQICRELSLKYPGKIELFLNDSNLGPHANALQVYDACFKSGAKYIAMLEGDDYWTDTHKLQKQVNFLEDHPDFVLSFHPIQILNAQNQLIDDFLTKVPVDYQTIETLARHGNYIHTPSVVFRNCLSSLPSEFEHCAIGDYFLYLVLAQQGKLYYFEDKMAVYRYGVGTFSGNSTLSMARKNLKLFTCVLSYFKDETIKDIIFARCQIAFKALDQSIQDQYKYQFVSGSVFFKTIKFVKENAMQPGKILKKAFSKYSSNK